MARKRLDAVRTDGHVGAVGDDLAPVAVCGIILWGGHELEIGRVFVGEDEKLITVMLQVVLHPLGARRDHRRIGGWLAKWNGTDLVGIEGGALEEEVRAILG